MGIFAAVQIIFRRSATSLVMIHLGIKLRSTQYQVSTQIQNVSLITSGSNERVCKKYKSFILRQKHQSYLCKYPTL
jgi:hypothetical protein